MKKYTVVYGDYFQTGSHTNCVTRYRHIEGNSVEEALELAKIDWEDVWFIFDGHCTETLTSV